MSPIDAPIHLRARFDGRTFVPETPVDVPEGTVVELWGEPAETNAPTKPQFGSAKGLIDMRSDFDDPLEEFAEYV